MENSKDSVPEEKALPLILLAAVVQGWSLYALHHAVKFHHWPATDYAILIPFYVLAVFIPLTVQLLATYARVALVWRFLAVLAMAFAYFGWHFGAHVSNEAPGNAQDADAYLQLIPLFGVLWLLVLPFVQSKLAIGRWAHRYGALFTHSWHNVLLLGEAALFTGLFWLLLFLWQMLFHLLKIDYFRELFAEPIFIYPVTALTFGCAIHLIGSITQLTAAVLEQLLNVFKWLATLAAVILTFFSIALLLSFPSLVFAGQKAIGAAWLLWLVAGMVLLLNAAYRDGSVPQPYPKWIANGLRTVVPLLVVIALTALYALIVRSRHYGLTVERVWAFIVATAGLAYSVGYTLTAFQKGAWLAALSRVNVCVAVLLIVIICAALTPVLSPYRLAANSQFRLVEERGLAAADPADARPQGFSMQRNMPLQYLRFDSGRYGRAKLKELADSYAGADSARIRGEATAMLATMSPYEAATRQDIPVLLGKMHVYPLGRTLNKDLSGKLSDDLGKVGGGVGLLNFTDEPAVGIYIDLNNDQVDEFVFLTPYRGRLYENRQGKWTYVGDVSLRSAASKNNIADAKRDLIDDLARGELSARPSQWNDLVIGKHTYRLNSSD